MRKLFIIPLLLLSLFASGQGTTFGSLNNGTGPLDNGDSLVIVQNGPKKIDAITALKAQTPTLPSTIGTIILTFSQDKVYQRANQTGDITFSLASSGNISGKTLVVDIVGDTIHTASFPGAWTKGGGAFDNRKENIIFLSCVNGSIYYNIVSKNRPDAIAPTYTMQNISGISSTAASYNLKINEDGQIFYTVTTSATPPSKADILAGTGATIYNTVNMTANTTNTVALSGLSISTSYYVYSYATDYNGNETSIQTGINFTTTSGGVAGVIDGFTRANSSSSLGVATSGQNWTIGTSGTVFGIASNQASVTTISGSGDNIAVIESLLGNSTTECDVIDYGGGGTTLRYSGIIFRYSDNQNYLKLVVNWQPGVGHKDVALYKVVGGVETTLAGPVQGLLVQFTNHIKVVTSGSSISVYVDNSTSSFFTYSDSFNSSATKVGLVIRNVSADSQYTLFDNFSSQ